MTRHYPYIDRLPGETPAVLLIHGILGSPGHFANLLPLIPKGWSVYNILLDGHGRDTKAFASTDMATWKEQVERQLDVIRSRHDRIILVGHSMGCLFCVEEAIKNPANIQSLFLLQIPLHPRLALKAAFGSMLLPFGIVIPSARDMAEDTSIRLDWKLWNYIGWIPRFLELFKECKHVRGILDQLQLPCQIFHSDKDEMVSNRTHRYLQRYPHIQTTLLKGAGHFRLYGENKETVETAFSRLFAKEAP